VTVRDSKSLYASQYWKTLRRAILERDGHRCQIVDPVTGLQCGDPATVCGHIVPDFMGGQATPENLRAECARHSALEGGMLAHQRPYIRTASRRW
jgi:5-methylcytosine-specific restriction endonuclease McrA